METIEAIFERLFAIALGIVGMLLVILIVALALVFVGVLR